jgi:hypothetical protein
MKTHGIQILGRGGLAFLFRALPRERKNELDRDGEANLVHAGGEYWELWHADGFDLATSSAAARIWQEAEELGYEARKGN